MTLHILTIPGRAGAVATLVMVLFNFPAFENSLYVIKLGLPSVKQEPSLCITLTKNYYLGLILMLITSLIMEWTKFLFADLWWRTFTLQVTHVQSIHVLILFRLLESKTLQDFDFVLTSGSWIKEIQDDSVPNLNCKEAAHLFQMRTSLLKIGSGWHCSTMVQIKRSGLVHLFGFISIGSHNLSQISQCLAPSKP